MRPVLYLLAALCLGLALAPAATAQTSAADRETTEQRLRDLQKQIARDEARLSQTREAEQASLQTLRNLDRQIALREELVSKYGVRLNQLQFERDSLLHSLDVLEDDLTELRVSYQQRAAHAYKHGRMHDLALIMAARSINEMLIRVRYLHRFADQRRKQLTDINEATAVLEKRRALLQSKVEGTEALLRDAESEQKKLDQLRRERTQMVAKLRSKQTEIESKIDENRTMASQLQGRIEALIAAETVRRERAPDAAADAAFTALSGSFRQNRGRLPWPSKGTVVEPYGDKVHPIHGTTTPNPGILIATPANAEVKAIFNGRVSSVDIIPDLGRYVIIEHGEYHSVYGNFSLLYIAEGEAIKAGQLIGRAGTNAEPKGAGVFFGLFKDGKPTDPTPWLTRR